MDEDAHRALGPAEDAGDLCRAHLLDEAQRQRPAPVVGERPHGARSAAAASSRVTASPRGRRVGIADARPAPPRATPAGRRRRLRRSFATVLRAIRNSHTRKVEALGPSSGRACSRNRGRAGERAQEHALGGVLGGVVVPELVEGEGIHLGEVLPIQGVEPGGVAPGRLHEGPVAIEGDRRTRRRGRALALPNTGPAIALHPPPREADAGDLARVDAPLAVRVRGGRRDHERAGRRPRRARRRLAAPSVLRASRAGRSSPGARSSRRRRKRRRGAPRSGPPPAPGTRRGAPRGRSAGRRTPRAGWSSWPRARAGSRPPPSRR